jgi:ABC-type lipoprotein export system ATPase subunit|tara:strand:- start:1778 stop:2446 length:669 start_codon:yes stop_codon:yes gene_type:complete
MLILKDLSKVYVSNSFQPTVRILDNINLSIKQGTLMALTGPSGSGKSTLLNLISGLDEVTSGTISINKNLITSLDANELCIFRNENISVVFQFFNLINDLTVSENISLPLLLRGENKKDIVKKVDKLVVDLGLNHRADYTTNLLSGGEAQRVAIARALITNPSIILADEPTGNLDKANTDNIIKILINLCKENHTTLIMVTHDNNLLSHFDMVYKLDSGVIT